MLPAQRADIQVDAVFDIETHEWDQFVVGGLLHRTGEYQEFGWRRETALAEAILQIEPAPGQKKAYVWAHNGGKFDALWLGDQFSELGVKFDMVNSGSGIAALRVGKLIVADSFMLTKQRLKDLTSSFGISKGKLGFPCIGKWDCAPDCEGYCRIARNMPRAWYKRLTEYLELDCRSLMNALQAVREFAAERDIDLGITVGSSAWKTAARWLELPKNDLLDRPREFRFARSGYFGGRVYKGKDFSPGVPFYPRAAVYDVNSMYPAALLNCAVPAGPCRGTVYGRTARAAYTARRPGVYAATVRVPEMLIPPLPVRDRKKRTCYPWGEFQGVWPLPELEYAETRGCVVEPFRAVTWSAAEKTFAPWARRLFDIRSAAPGGKKSPLGNFTKFLLNALTGKLGARATLERNFHDRDIDRTRLVCRCDGICRAVSDPREKWHCGCRGRCEKWCEGECGRVLPVDVREDHRYWRSTHWRIQECGRPQIAAYLTGYSRSWVWHAQAIDGPGGDGSDVCYGDTDSLFTEFSRAKNLGKDLGQWDLEGYFRDATFIAPKTYTLTMLKPDGKTVQKQGAKGVRKPKPGELVPDWNARTAKLDTGQRMKGIRSAMKDGKLFQRIPKDRAQRSLSWQWGDRLPMGDGTSRPLNANEIQFEED